MALPQTLAAARQLGRLDELKREYRYAYQIPSDNGDCDSLDQHGSYSNQLQQQQQQQHHHHQQQQQHLHHHHHQNQHPPPFESDSPAANTAAIFRAHSDASSINQSPIHPLSLHAPNGGSYDYRSAPSSSISGSELPLQGGLSLSPLPSSRGSSTTSHNSASASYAFIGQQNTHIPLNSNVSYHGIGSHPGASSTLYTPSTYSQTPLQATLDRVPRLSNITRTPDIGMPPPSRNLAPSNSVSPQLTTAFRSDFSNISNYQQRHGYTQASGVFPFSPSPQSPLSAMSRSLESSLGPGSQSVPPFEATKTFYPLVDGRNHAVHAELQAKIDKGFFRADQDWTCYRRNYFSVACAYSLKTDHDAEPQDIFLQRSTQASHAPERIKAFSVCIAAKVDGEDGKAIELVQHTPKRDKGPMSTPERKELKSNPSGNLAVFSGSSSFPSNHLHMPEYDHTYQGGSNENNNVATFERIQFKKATANNGKRRAAQQYFHIVVELYAKVQKNAKSDDHEWLRIAHRLSAQMVVRGRSPGHYSDERRGSSTSMGPGGAPGNDFTGLHGDRRGGGMTSSMFGGVGGQSSFARMGGNYQTHHASITNSPPSDTPSVPSSASSIASGNFMDPLQTSSLGLGDATMHDIYDAQFDNQLQPSSHRSNSILRPALSGSLQMNVSPFNFMGASPLKLESPSMKTEQTRQPRLGAPFSPSMHSDWTSSSSRDCRPIAVERNRSGVWSSMSAL